MAHDSCVTRLSSLAAAATIALSSATLSGTAQQPPTFVARSELVVLHVSVTDRGGAHVGGLNPSAFHVFEDGRPQDIRFFASEDTPATIGLLIDSSGSMAPVRDRVIAASAAFVEASNSRDEVFALVFNDDVRPVLPEERPFTGDADLLRRTMAGAFMPAGRTALYDAIDSGLRYLTRGSLERRALVVLSDGGDNASRAAARDVTAAAQSSNAIIFSIAIVDPFVTESNPRTLAKLADQSGGEAFAPHNPADIDRAFQTIATGIRRAYTIGYVPEDGRSAERAIRVDVDSPEGRRLNVRTRKSYHAG